MRVTFRFRDCPRIPDTCLCAQDISDSGGNLVGGFETNFDSCIGTIPFDVDDHGKFMEKFRSTKSYVKLIRE